MNKYENLAVGCPISPVETRRKGGGLIRRSDTVHLISEVPSPTLAAARTGYTADRDCDLDADLDDYGEFGFRLPS